MRHDDVVRAAQTRDRIEENHDVLAVLDQPLGFLDHHVRHLHVPVGRFVERRGDHFDVRPLHVFFHVGHLFRPLVDEQHDEVDLGVILDDGVGELLHQDGLTGFRR